MRFLCRFSAFLLAFPTLGHAAHAQAPVMPDVIQRYSADRQALEATYTVHSSVARLNRLQSFDEESLKSLKQQNFSSFSNSDQLDYLLLQNLLQGDLHDLSLQRTQRKAMEPVLPFAPTLETIFEKKRLMQRPDAEATAKQLTEITDTITRAEHDLDPKNTAGNHVVDPVTANRAVGAVMDLQSNLHTWFDQYNGYDPQFTWWDVGPYRDTDKALSGYIDFLKKSLIGIAADDKTTIIGDPVGRDALMKELAVEHIPYTPEELVAIAQTEYDWCMKQMLIASHEMGYGDDWHKAVEKVKTMHVPPGEQPDLIRKLVLQGDEFVKKNDLVTVPPLAEETWRMIMMTPERQLVNPFFTGGDEISVSYPTNTMTYAQREMSMRGNNIPFAHATAFHEMIPGHFLQYYIAQRYHPYRQPFETPFWVEGNSLWWEMLFWDRGFDSTPEERVGALVWRMHRSARVIFTMNFHLGKWTPQQCVQFLIDAVGFEPDNATAEVRRSFDGSVGPLYQCAYLMGGLQFRAMHHELVDSHKMTDREFHDTILQQGAMPLALLRASMEHEKLTPDYNPQWKFYGEHPTHAPLNISEMK
ncbi:MAG: DUF885 family protein [Acidobacteriaceae bacterium]|nr:DUF885 family protein [Acidobacteriaceae bacterium]